MITIDRGLKTAIDNWKTGNYGEDQYEELFTCPVCGEKTYELYYNNYTNMTVGCSCCIEIKNEYDDYRERIKWKM